VSNLRAAIGRPFTCQHSPGPRHAACALAAGSALVAAAPASAAIVHCGQPQGDWVGLLGVADYCGTVARNNGGGLAVPDGQLTKAFLLDARASGEVEVTTADGLQKPGPKWTEPSPTRIHPTFRC